MSLYVDLLPPPQFDRSLVAYTVGNFQRIKETLTRASGRVYVTSGSIAGPWPASLSVNIPFKSDILYSASVSVWGTVATLLAMQTLVDTTNLGFCEQWFNEINTHKTLTGFFVARGISAGAHNFGTAYGTGGLNSDATDRFKFGLVCVEV